MLSVSAGARGALPLELTLPAYEYQMNAPLRRPATHAKVGLLFIRRAIPHRGGWEKAPFHAAHLYPFLPPQGSLQGHGSPSGSEMAQETMAGSGDRLNPESRRQALPVAVFRARQACSLSPPPPLPLQHLPNYRAGLGLACKPSSGFLAAWLFQSQPCRSSTAYTEAASLGGAELGASR